MKFTKTVVYVLLATAASVGSIYAEGDAEAGAVDTSSIAPVDETVKKLSKKGDDSNNNKSHAKHKKKSDTEASDSSAVKDDATQDADAKVSKNDKKAKKNSGDDDSFADKSSKRIAKGNSDERKDAKKKLDGAKTTSAGDRKKVAEDITEAYKAAEIAQRQADGAMSVAQTSQMQADTAYTHCLGQLCDGIQKGAFRIGQDMESEENKAITQKADEIETIKATVADMEKTRSKMLDSNTKAINTAAMSKSVVEELEGRIASALDGEAVVADDNKAKLEAELAIAKSEADAVGMNLEMAKKAVAALKKAKLSTDKKSAEVADLTDKKAAAGKKVSDLEDKIKDLPKVEATVPDVSEFGDQLNKERRKLAKAENAQKILKDKLDKIQQEIDKNLEKIAPLEDALRKFVTKSALNRLGSKDTKTAKKLKADVAAKKGDKDAGDDDSAKASDKEEKKKETKDDE